MVIDLLSIIHTLASELIPVCIRLSTGVVHKSEKY
jgi:hypothetical protein